MQKLVAQIIYSPYSRCARIIIHLTSRNLIASVIHKIYNVFVNMWEYAFVIKITPYNNIDTNADHFTGTSKNITTSNIVKWIVNERNMIRMVKNHLLIYCEEKKYRN